MNTQARAPARHARQGGAALVIGLILLLVMTVLAVASMSSSTMGLQMTASAQSASNAFQAAEQGISATIETYTPDTQEALVELPEVAVDDMGARYAIEIGHDSVNGCTEVPDGGFSLGEGVSFKALHFDVRARAAAARGASVDTTQSYWTVSPPGTDCIKP
jgi:type IV pilus assembly protein PilX